MRKDFKRQEKKNLLEEKVISITRVTKVTQGGRHFRFCATVAVGNRKGLVGIGSGKANEVPEAIKKALQAANKNVCKVSLSDGRTIQQAIVDNNYLKRMKAAYEQLIYIKSSKKRCSEVTNSYFECKSVNFDIDLIRKRLSEIDKIIQDTDFEISKLNSIEFEI